MKNLKLVSHNSIKLCYKLQNNCKLSIDPISNEKYITDDERISCIDGCAVDFENRLFSKKWEDLHVDITNIIGVEVISSLNSITVITLQGDVLTVNIEDQSVDVVGCVSDGITGCGWSPDQEILVLITGKLSVILMTTDFEPFAELSLEQEDFGASKFINVGWGKKETQFHGTEGKQAAKNAPTKSTTLFEWDDRTPRVSWRGDGQMFAVSYVSCQDVRKFRVVSREGAIQYTSADVEGLENCLSWKPSGDLIASSQRLSNKHNIIFFEKNGLQHGGFTLHCEAKELIVEDLRWNEDSTVLLVWVRPFDCPDQNFIQLWTVGNYHWYLKQELRFCERIYDLKWDPENPLILHIVTQSDLHNFKFTKCVNFSRGHAPSDNSQVAVIDGNRLLVTPFKQVVVPPPLSAYEIVFPGQIHSVIYGPSVFEKLNSSFDNSLGIEDSGFLDVHDSQGINSNSICVFYGKDTLAFLAQAPSHQQLNDFGVEVKATGVGGNGFQVRTQLHRVISQIKIELIVESVCPQSFATNNIYNWNWVNKNTMVSSYRQGSQHSIIIFELVGIGTEEFKIIARSKINVEDEVITISSTADGSLTCLQLRTGDLLKLNVVDETVEPWLENGVAVKFPSVCDHLLLCPIDRETIVPLGLTFRHRLYLVSCQLLADCTSVHLHNEHVLITTTSHNLLVVPMTSLALKSLSQCGRTKDEFSAMGARRLERGSRIITAVSCDTKVLFQMPRGNLEMINPRHLVVHKLKSLLSDRQYYSALDIMRKHRIDMNLAYDHCPKEFLDNVQEFVRNVDNPVWLDLFIASLNSNDVTKSCYNSNYPAKEPESPPELDKITSVCEALRKSMRIVDEEKFLLPILTTYVKNSNTEIHLALALLKELKNTKDKVFKVSFEEGMRHLLYVADADELCDVALGMYDFDLVMLIFEKSQKDPKEYIPFLNNFKQMEENYRKYKINVHLKRYKSAIECILHCDIKYNDEFLSFIIKETLFGEALSILKRDSLLYLSTCDAYGDYLLKKGYHNEAASIFYRGQQLERALECYEQACNWKMALTSASNLNCSKERYNRLCISLTEKLQEKNCFSDAAVIFERYTQSEEDAVECYCKAKLWEDAMLVASKHGRKDLVETIIIPGVLDHFETIDKEIREMKCDFSRNFERLNCVRSEKRKQFLDLLDGKGEQLDSDLFSDSSTVTGCISQRSNTSKATTSASAKTYRSSKNRRKLDRKKYSTKEGSNFEDLGLIVQLHEIITNACALTKVVSDLNRCLLSFNEELKAKLLQDELGALISDMQKKKFRIWINCAPDESEFIEFGPQMTTETAVKQLRGDNQKESLFFTQRIKELDPIYQFPPSLDKVSGWKLYSLDMVKQ